jgi:glycosyltransferase involved in cell wall biosynthesis
MSFWIKPDPVILLHMHGSTNALAKSKNKLFRNKLFQNLWEYLRTVNIKKATRIIAIDPLCYNLIKKRNRKENAIFLPNFVDTNIFFKDGTSCQLLKHIKENILLFVGRIEEVKGLELFVDTLTEIDRRETGRWKGVIVGRGTFETQIKKYIADKSVVDLFYFAGAVFEQDELRRIYNMASILMISSYFEGIPMVILESLACGTPVISTNVGGIKDFISDNKMCFVNDKRDPGEFSNLIQSITNHQKDSIENNFKFSAQKASSIINQILHAKL